MSNKDTLRLNHDPDNNKGNRSQVGGSSSAQGSGRLDMQGDIQVVLGTKSSKGADSSKEKEGKIDNLILVQNEQGEISFVPKENSRSSGR